MTSRRGNSVPACGRPRAPLTSSWRWPGRCRARRLLRAPSMRHPITGSSFFFFQAEDGIRDFHVTGVQTCALPILRDRFERLEETLQICLQMWSDNNGPYEGRHYQLAETLCVPAPVSQPRPPILIGGGGEQKTLRLVARYADLCNVFGTSPDDVARKFDILRGHC